MTRSNWDMAPIWFKWALHEIGVKEIPGSGDSKRIIEYRRLGGILIKGGDGDVPWCKIFVNAAFRVNGYPIAASPMARSIESDKSFDKIKTPLLGCVVSFWRGSKNGGLGHIGFYRGESSTHVYTLEGNASDAVGINPHRKSSGSFGLVGYYWPKTYPKMGPTIAGPIAIRAGKGLADVSIV